MSSRPTPVGRSTAGGDGSRARAYYKRVVFARSPTHLTNLISLAFGKNKVTHAGRQALVDRFGDRVTFDG